MRQILFVLVVGLAAIAQEAAPAQPQLTEVPPKPSCNPDALFHTTACVDLWNAYNQALAERQRQELQLYVSKQKDLAAAPLLQQIANQQGEIKRLQADLPLEESAYRTEGVVYGAGGTLVLFGLIFLIRRLASGFTVTKRA
jgi:hypothetical protein